MDPRVSAAPARAQHRWSRLRYVAICAGLAFALAASARDDYGMAGHEAPDFTLRAANGANVRLSEHRGEVVVLSFWGSRCIPCRDQLAALDRSLATYRSAGLQVYGVGIDDDPQRALDWAHAQRVSFPILLDPGKAVSAAFRVDNLPMTVLVDRSGMVRFAHRDFSGRSEQLYLQQLRVLLNE